MTAAIFFPYHEKVSHQDGSKLCTSCRTPRPFTAFSAVDTLKTRKVEQEPQSEPNAQAPEEINKEIVRKELMTVDDNDGPMDAEDGGGVD